jgi:hypothetical protein
MAYFYSNQDAIERGAKIAADVFCAALLLVFSLVFFGLLGGLLAFVIIEAALVGVDYLVPDDTKPVGAVIR